MLVKIKMSLVLKLCGLICVCLLGVIVMLSNDKNSLSP